MEKTPKYTPVLGLSIEGDAPSASGEAARLERERALPVERPDWPLELTVIVPARNEEENLPGCLASLLAQNDTIFRLGVDWELIVVDDASADGTRRLAQDLRDRTAAENDGFRVLEAPAFEVRGAARTFTGKTNACWAGAQSARGRWLLFTDADTLHEPGDLRRALHEAERHHVSMLSYSPRQRVTGVAQRLVMPLIFSELATTYPPRRVNDPDEKIAAANGQFLLVEHGAYLAAGGHRAVGRSVLEDVELAFNIKRGKRSIRLRYAPEQVSARMYRGFGDLVEGWTKNLALLFPQALALALWRLLDLALFCLIFLIPMLPYLVMWQKVAIFAIWIRTLFRFYQRVARAGFPVAESALSVFGLPLFSWLLVRSWMRHRFGGGVTWKGREYR